MGDCAENLGVVTTSFSYESGMSAAFTAFSCLVSETPARQALISAM
jgi:hypothetical protein